MKIEMKNDILDIEDVASGTVGLFETKDGYIQFKAMIIKDIDYENPILFDIEEDNYLNDIKNYKLLQIYDDCKLVIS